MSSNVYQKGFHEQSMVEEAIASKSGYIKIYNCNK